MDTPRVLSACDRPSDAAFAGRGAWCRGRLAVVAWEVVSWATAGGPSMGAVVALSWSTVDGVAPPAVVGVGSAVAIMSAVRSMASVWYS